MNTLYSQAIIMEQETPVSVFQSDSETSEQFIAVAPFAEAVIKGAVHLATDVAREVIEPELTQQQRRRSTKNQAELLAIELDLWQIEMDLLEAKSPGRVLSRMFASDPQTREDIQNLAAVRTELGQMTNAQRQSVSMEPRDFVMQQAMGSKSAIGMPEADV